MEQLLPFIGEIGFPILVALYLLYRIETRIDTIIQMIKNLPERIKHK
ncbi:YvrJ family protein [Bacillus chungangensis]|uniref:YvrJ family protein n=1 Tax=Bacillus chungangensis TaxID=587633 RepID=A0ABT9WZ78_9BACI|nr:YvrJ family protein [Bacillus chungangensis]MDQ0178505.1 hypothetical protein [Bacillus chungangensis]